MESEEALWQQIVASGADRSMGTEAVVDDFKQVMGGLLPDEASASEMRAYLDQLDTAGVPA